MKIRYVIYVILEALLVALAVYMINVIYRMPVADSMASIGYDITLSKDAYIEDADITLAKGTTVNPTVIANANEVTFYVDEFDGRLSLDVEYFVEKEDLIKLYEQRTSEAQKLKKDRVEKDILFSVITFVIYLFIASVLTWIFREKVPTLYVHRVLTAILIAGTAFMYINIF